MMHEEHAKATLTAVELDIGDELTFVLKDGVTRSIRVHSAKAIVERRGMVWDESSDNGVLRYRISCVLDIDGHHVELVRTIPSDQNFVAPNRLLGMRMWLDAVSGVSEFLTEDHGECFPARHVRLAVWDERSRICPILLHPWCPLPENGLQVSHCYRGEDTWMGPFRGRDAHGGLDINHPAGTPLWAPIPIDEHRLFDRIGEDGANNNRWRGLHTWPDGSAWVLQSHHLIRLLAPEEEPMPAGTLYAESAGVHPGAVEHSHFVFRVRNGGDEVMLDPWLLFWQMYEDRRITRAGSW